MTQRTRDPQMNIHNVLSGLPYDLERLLGAPPVSGNRFLDLTEAAAIARRTKKTSTKTKSQRKRTRAARRKNRKG